VNARLLKILSDIGLDAQEAAVYLATLSLGPSSVQRIAREAGIKRTTAYGVLESLRQKTLINEEMRGFKRVFAPLHPEKLQSLLSSRERMFRDALPEFAALYNLKAGEDTIKFYEGLESTKEIYEGLLADIRPREEYMIISTFATWLQLDPDYLNDFSLRRAELSRALGFNIRLLIQDTPAGRERKKQQKLHNEKIKILPKNVAMTTNLVIIPKKVVIHQVVPPINAMVIYNPHIIRMHQEVFEMLWAALPD
jgi:sugar-specific transcriptional regulator TrmB